MLAGSAAAMIDYAVPFLFVIGVLVVVHEFGHYLVARALGIRVVEFALGMGPELFGRTDRRGCRWALRLLPLGGYVRFWGDENAASANAGGTEAAFTPEERAVAYQCRPPGHRALVLIGGPAANFLLALLVMSGLYGTIGRQHTPPRLDAVLADGPAAAAGFRPGDLVLSVDGVAVERFEDLQQAIARYPGRSVAIAVRHADGTQETLRVVPKAVRIVNNYGMEAHIGRIGIQAAAPTLERLSLVDAVVYGARDVWFFTAANVVSLGEIVAGWRSIDEIGGPVKIVQIAGGAAKVGLVNLVAIVAVLSVGLGVINLMPFPVLDGGHLVVCAYEAATRRRASPRVLGVVFRGGAAAILVLLAVITWNDVAGIYRQFNPTAPVGEQGPSR